MNGGNINASSEEGAEVKMSNDAFMESLSKDLTPEDIRELQKAGVDLSTLTIASVETM